MADFLEERLDHQKIKMGASFAEQYAVNIVTTSGGNEYRSLIHPFPARTFDISQLLEKSETFNYILALYNRAHGQYAGFRLRCYDEFSSNGNIGTPTALDQPTLVLTATTRQMVKQYGTNGTAGASGYPYRKIRKPVAGTVLVAKNGTPLSGGDFTVDTTTGIIAVATAIISDTITAGFQFDWPVRFNGSLVIGQDYPTHRNADGIELIEILNP